MQSPHVHGGCLSAEQVAEYERDGFLVLPRYLDANTVAEMDRAAVELVGQVGPVIQGNPRIQVDPIGDGLKIRQVWPVIDLSPTYARLATDERIVGLFRSLFADTPVLFEDKVNYKYPSGGTPFPLHQDLGYWGPYTNRLVTALIYIDAATEENGCLEVAPGRHTQGLLDRVDVRVGLGTDHHIPEQVIDSGEVRKVPGPPGTLILFSCLTPHGSTANLSRHPRRALMYTYNPAADGAFYEEAAGANRNRANAWLGANDAGNK
jgi:ectoine hydroxylase-related dioxygenase (phytanoyl-CoA dioxygenase family)